MDTAAPLPELRLKRQEDRRLRQGHNWVYSNEVDIKATPLKGFTAGTQVLVRAAGGRPLGVACVNPHALICARLLDRHGESAVGIELLRQRLRRARALRDRLYERPFYRLAYGDSDGLPGLIVDRYGEVLVVQVTTAGMEAMLDDVIAVLVDDLAPAGILLRNDSSAREAEQLPAYTRVAHGAVPELIELEENGVRFRVAAAQGQKTGWFYDHRDNRRWLAPLCRDRRVLDVFSYAGGWGVQAACAGAAGVLCIDSSAPALERVADSAALNGVGDRVRGMAGNAFEALQELASAGERFDVVVLDPPAFIKRKRDQQSGENAYHRLNREAMKLLAEDAILVSASCSMHLAEEALLDIVRGAAVHAGREAQILRVAGQAADHPIHPAIPETRYLKAVCCRVV